jgi:hypothetical protein
MSARLLGRHLPAAAVVLAAAAVSAALSKHVAVCAVFWLVEKYAKLQGPTLCRHQKARHLEDADFAALRAGYARALQQLTAAPDSYQCTECSSYAGLMYLETYSAVL